MADEIVGTAAIQLRARLDRLARDLDAARAKADAVMGQAGQSAGKKFSDGFKIDTGKIEASLAGIASFARGGVIVAGLAAVANAAGAIPTALADAGDSLAQLQARLATLTGSAAGFDLAVANARLLGVSIDDAGSSLARLAVAGQGLGLTVEQAAKLAATFGQIGKLSGLGAAELGSALTQFSQAVGSGVLQGDEFKSLSEAMPQLVDLIAKSMNVSRGELKKLASEGEVTAKVLVDALTGAAGGIEKQFKALGSTGEMAATNLGTSWTMFLAELDKQWSTSTLRKELFGGLDAAIQGATALIKPATAQDRLGAARDRLSKLGDTSQNGFGAELARQLQAEIVALEVEADTGRELARRVAALGAGTPAVTAPKPSGATRPSGAGTKPSRSTGGGMSEAARQQLEEAEAVERSWLDGLQAREDAETDVAEAIQRLMQGTADLEARAALAAQASVLERTSAGRVELAVLQERFDLLRETAEISEVAGAAELEQLRALIEARVGAVRAGAEMQEAVARLDEIEAFSDDAASSIVGTLREITLEGTSASDAVKGLGLALAELVLRQAVLEPAANAISASLQQIIGASAPSATTASPAGGAVQSGLGSLFTAGIGALFGFADGGVWANGAPQRLERFAHGGISTRAAIFGEGDMAEAAVPLPDGRSIPVSFKGNPGPAGGGGGDNVYVDARGSTDVNLVQVVAMRAVKAMLDQHRRNPNLSRR